MVGVGDGAGVDVLVGVGDGPGVDVFVAVGVEEGVGVALGSVMAPEATQLASPMPPDKTPE